MERFRSFSIMEKAEYLHEIFCDEKIEKPIIIGQSMEADLAYDIKCPALLICGEHDKAGSVQRYNRKWTENTGIPLVWIPDAGHNSNTDNPDYVNREIEKFLSEIK